MPTYPSIYRDRLGEVVTSLQDDHHHLRTTLRGVVFSGPDFDSLSPERPLTPDERGLFVLAGDTLCACALSWTMPLTISANGHSLAAQLHASLDLGGPTASGGITHERLALRLVWPTGELASRGLSGWFEDELLDLQAQLPPDHLLHICFACAHSDYSPYGHGLWGKMACFRGCKDDYARVGSKAALFEIWDRATEHVPETFSCPDFRRRLQGTGYRG